MNVDAISATPMFWFALTVIAYVVSKWIYLRWRRAQAGVWWLSPMLITPLSVMAVLAATHTGYDDYLHGAHWLILMLGPATVAFALPIHRERALIRRYWKLLLIGVFVGSTVAVLSAWLLAHALQLEPALQKSLLPRSVTTPFAMNISTRIGGIAELTAVLVVITGLFGAIVGERLLAWLPRDAAFARGTAYGMAAHGVGVARAYELGAREGAVAGLTMVLAGIVNVLLMPMLLLAW